MPQVLKVDDLKRRNFMGTKPNVYKRSLEARETTDSFLLAAAGLPDPIKVPWHRRLQVWEIGLIVLAGVALCVSLWVL